MGLVWPVSSDKWKAPLDTTALIKLHRILLTHIGIGVQILNMNQFTKRHMKTKDKIAS